MDFPRITRASLWVALPYTVLVLALDLLAIFGSQTTMLGSFDEYKFLFWFVIPLLLTYADWDFGYYGFSRWRKVDFAFLLVMLALGLVAVKSMRFFPAVSSYYPPLSHLSAPERWHFLWTDLIWTLSWLPGWEFLNRYYLLRAAKRYSPRFALYLLPIVEGAYHIQKPVPEMVGMVALSYVLTLWAIRRNNGLLPLLVHAGIEIGLAIFLIS